MDGVFTDKFFWGSLQILNVMAITDNILKEYYSRKLYYARILNVK
jgi:hypothetical protein